MHITRAAALLYVALSAGVVAFQVALAAGAPWGAYAMGGAFPEQFPPGLRIAALGQAALVVGMAAVVMSRAGLLVPGWSHVSRRLVWFVVAFAAVMRSAPRPMPRNGVPSADRVAGERIHRIGL